MIVDTRANAAPPPLAILDTFGIGANVIVYQFLQLVPPTEDIVKRQKIVMLPGIVFVVIV